MASSPSRIPRIPISAVLVLTLVLALVLVIAPGSIHAATPFESLRSPGQAGFIAAHRGGAEAPENTLASLRSALAGPAAYVETDIQLTSDGVPVLMHDWTVDRTTDGSGPVWSFTFDELSGLDAGSWFGQDFAGVRVPSLAQFLTMLEPSGKDAIIELKGSWNREQVEGVVDQLTATRLTGRVILASFSLTTLQNLRDVAEEIPRAIIDHKVTGDPANLAEACGAIAIITSRAFLEDDPEAVERIHAAGLGVLAYTLNRADAWEQALALGVDGFITDDSIALGDWLGGQP
jgi:glycerophosphoryl diester phosphodiesterase